jgi:hypothetical protein
LIVSVTFIFFLWVTPSLEVGGLCGWWGALLMGEVWDDDDDDDEEEEEELV